MMSPFESCGHYKAKLMSEDSSQHSVTRYISGLVRGDEEAVNQIWEKYFGRLLNLARTKLQSCPKRFADEDDVVQKAFENFFRNVQENRFPKLNNRDDLWQILCMIVGRKAIDQFRKATSGPIVNGDSINKNSAQTPVLNAAMNAEPPGNMAVEFAEEFEKRISSLKKKEYQKLAMLKLAGFKNQEAADEMKCGLRTIERWLEYIRGEWSDLIDDE